MITVKRYTPENHQTWNEFVKQSRQGTFLFDRNYMDYHQDRFHDHSLMIYYKDKLYALLPANEVVSASGNKVVSDSDIEISLKELVSHQGLTYGGLLTCNKMTAALTCETFEAIGNYLKQEGFSKLTYKAIPWIYHKIPSEEDLYALIHTGKASLSTREISTTIPLQNKLRFSEQRRRGIRKAKRNQLIIRQSTPEDVLAFWNILNNNLQQKYHTRPVHSNEELQLLMSRFRKHHRLFCSQGRGSHCRNHPLHHSTSNTHPIHRCFRKGEGRGSPGPALRLHHQPEEMERPIHRLR